MRSWVVALLIGLITLSLTAQDTGLNDAARPQLTIMPFYQSRSLEPEIKPDSTTNYREFATRFDFSYPVTDALTISMRGAGGNSTLEPNNRSEFSLSGLGDIQLNTAYRLLAQNLVLGVRMNLPTGKKELSPDETLVSNDISNPVLEFQLPGFGQGLNIAPSATWAHALNENVAFGLGASFQYRGSYKFSESSRDYDPGDEILITTGIDFRLNESGTLSADLIYTTYGEDTAEGVAAFASGDKFVSTLRFLQFFDFNQLLLQTRFRSRSKNDLIPLGAQNKTIPNSFDLMAHYMIRANNVVYLGFGIEGRFYEELEENNRVSGGNVLGLRFTPRFQVSDAVAIPLALTFMTGTLKNETSLRGFGGGIGFSASF